MPDHLAALGHAADQGEDQTAQAVDVLVLVLGGDLLADHGLEGIDLRPGIHVPHARSTGADRGRVLVVVLVLDIADNRFDQVFQRHQPVGTAILVDHQGEMHAPALHAAQEIGRLHGGRGEQERPADRRQDLFLQPARQTVALAAGGEMPHHVLDMRNPDRIVEGLAIDGQARMGRFGKALGQFVERGRDLHADDVGARDHHVGDPQLVERVGLDGQR